MSRVWTVALAAGAVSLTACSDSDSGLSVPAKYEFESRFVPGESSVSYTGQICRHVLITALTNAVRDQNEIAGNEYRGENVPYFDDTITGSLAEQDPADILGLTLPTAAGQDSLEALCGNKHLKPKFAGNDTDTDHRDWNSEFVGIQGESSAEAYLRRLLQEVSEQAEQGTQAPGAPHYVSPEGIDYAQMIQKFLLGAVPFSQGTDDYLDNDPNTPGKGLLATNQQSGSNPYATLEHQFDEGYGYFGAARAYADRTDEVNRSGVVDDNGDGILDIESEHNFGASTNAAKRDVGSADSAKTDFTGEAFLALRRGRAIITAAGVDFADMTAAQQEDLLAARDNAVAAWEGAIAATVVHYINDTLDDLAAIDSGGFDIEDLAKHFSEMKGFALGLQFNPRSPLHAALGDGSGESKFARLHELLRDQPPCSGGVCVNEPQYRDDLLEARALMGEAYGFAEANLEVW